MRLNVPPVAAQGEFVSGARFLLNHTDRGVIIYNFSGRYLGAVSCSAGALLTSVHSVQWHRTVTVILRVEP